MKYLAAIVLLVTATGAFAQPPATATPIKHLVVIFQENVSFDHYFGTYPHAENPPGEPPFHALPGTPTVNGLTYTLLEHNPNAVAPFRLNRSQAVTCDQDHRYTAEQRAYHGGLVDHFLAVSRDHADEGCDPKLVMGYYDGNTVTAYWHYAQHFAMSDNSFGSTFGPSTPGAMNLVSGQTHGAEPAVEGLIVAGTMIGDPAPAFDDCARRDNGVAFDGRNIGNLLNAKGVTWGWFQGGFRPTDRKADGAAVCGSQHKNAAGEVVTDYLPHHEPFQYFESTSNPHHLPPVSIANIGHDGHANHQYGLKDFWNAVEHGNLPAVSYIKARAYQDGHAGYSGPIDEQHFVVETINRLQKTKFWPSMAIIIAYDDSDGWYDHVMPPIVNHSDTKYDVLLGEDRCGERPEDAYAGRCGYGPRLPLLVVSPWAKQNFVDHSLTDQTSILRFIEDNWHLGRIGDQSFDAKAGTLANLFDFSHIDMRRLILDPQTGEPHGHT